MSTFDQDSKATNFRLSVVLAVATAAACLSFPFISSHAQEASGQLEEIVITGSRITRRDFVSPSPIATMDQEAIQSSGFIAIDQAVQELPQFVPDNSGNQGSGARSLVDLRGLGASRNLVLLDGRRLPVSSAFGEVDTAILPSTIIDNVETITGGASAVYGSDAMSGVVNFISVRNFEGVRADAQYGISAQGDYPQWSTSVMAGGEYASGRGYGYLALSSTHRGQVLGKDRDFFQFGTPSSFIGFGTFVPGGNTPSQAAVDALFTSYGVDAADLPPASDRMGFNDDGTLFSQNFGGQNYSGGTYDWVNGWAYYFNGSGVRMPVATQRTEKDRLSQRNLFAKSEYEFTNGITGYVQVLATNHLATTNTGGTLTQFGNPVIPITNPFIPADLATLLASRGDPTADFAYNRRYVEVPSKKWDEEYFSQQYIGGFRGELPISDWTWDAYLAWDRVVHQQTQLNAVFLSRVQNLVEASDGGVSICDGGYNPFGRAQSSATSQECIDYISGTTSSSEKMIRAAGEAVVQGTLFEAPAGPVQFAAIAGFRRDDFDFNPDKALAEQDVQAVVAASPVEGSTSVNELAFEANIPVVDSLTVNLAARISDYELSGTTNTWKADGIWRPMPSLLVRGGYQKAIRAPNIGELFSPETGDQVGFGNPPGAGDPCDSRRTGADSTGSNAQLRQLCIDTGIPAGVVDTYIFPTSAAGGVESGNPNLDPETADTYTFGVVLTPDFDSELFSNLSVSLDYYSIEITDVVSTIGGGISLNKCYNLDGSNPSYDPNNFYCGFIVRDPALGGEFDTIRQPFENLGELSTSGYDLGVNWVIDASAFGMNTGGSFSVESQVSFGGTFEQITIPGEQALDYAGTIGGPGGIKPDWSTLTTFGYSQGPMSVNLRWYALPDMEDDSRASNPNTTRRGVDSYSKWNLTGTYSWGDQTTFRAGITNLLDEDIPLVGNNPGGTNSGVYDIVGRSYYVGVRMEF